MQDVLDIVKCTLVELKCVIIPLPSRPHSEGRAERSGDAECMLVLIFGILGIAVYGSGRGAWHGC